MRDDYNRRPFTFKYRLQGESRWRIDRWLKRAYVRLWMSGLAMRTACASCTAKVTAGPDISIGDAWGVEKYAPWGDDGRGLSVVIAYTQKGISFVQRNTLLLLSEVPYDAVVRGNPAIHTPSKAPMLKSAEREEILKELESDGDWVKLATRILGLGFFSTLSRFFRRILK